MKELYNDIFISRQKSLQFVVSERDKQTGSRIGGYAPSYFDDDLIMEKYSLQRYVYYFSIGADLLPNLYKICSGSLTSRNIYIQINHR